MSFAFFLRRRLQDVFKTFDQDEYIRLSLRSSEDAFKTSSRRLGQDQYIRLGHMSSRLFQDFFKTSSRRLAKIPSRRFQDVFKLFFLTRLGEVFNPFLILSFPKVSTEGFPQVTLLLRNLMPVYKICKRNKNFPSFSFSLYYILVAAHKGVFRTLPNIYNGFFFAQILNFLDFLKVVL